MKILILMMSLTGCAHSKYPISRDSTEKVSEKKKNHIDRMYDCVLRLIEQNGVEATVAQDVCANTLRRK